MHSMPPLVTISSAALGPPALQLLLALDQVLAHARDPLARRVLQRDGRRPRARSRAAISSSSSVGNVAGFGNPPVIESTPGGLPARIVGQLVAAAQARPAGERARRSQPSTRKASALASPRSSAATCSAWFVRSCSASPRACAARIARSLRADRLRRSPAPPRSAAAGRSARRRRRRTRCRPGATSTPPQTIVRAGRGARHGRARARRRAAREHRQPDARAARARRGRSRR